MTSYASATSAVSKIDRIAGVFSTETRDLVRAGNGDLFTPLPLGSSDKILRIDPVTGSDSPVATGGLLVFPDGLVLEDGPDPLPDDDTNKRSLLVVDTNTSLTDPAIGLGVYRIDVDDYDSTDPEANQTL